MALGLALSVGVTLSAVAQIPPANATANKVETEPRHVALQGRRAEPETVAKAYDYLDLMHGVEAFINAYQGASVASIFKGCEEAGMRNNAALNSRS